MYNKYLLILLLILFGCDSNTPNKGCNAIVTWGTPTLRVNGELLLVEDISRTTIYVNSAEGKKQQDIERIEIVTDSSLNEWKIKNLPKGKLWFYMTVSDEDLLESAKSNELSKVC